MAITSIRFSRLPKWMGQILSHSLFVNTQIHKHTYTQTNVCTVRYSHTSTLTHRDNQTQTQLTHSQFKHPFTHTHTQLDTWQQKSSSENFIKGLFLQAGLFTPSLITPFIRGFLFRTKRLSNEHWPLSLFWMYTFFVKRSF